MVDGNFMSNQGKTIYLWDAGGTLFPEKWTWSEYKNFDDFLAYKYPYGCTELEEEIIWEEAYRKQYFNLTLNKGFKKVLQYTKNNYILTSGNPGQMDARREVYFKKYKTDINDYLMGVISRFDYKRKNLKKDRGLFKLVLQDYFNKGYREFVYTEDKLKTVKEFVAAAEELKKLKKCRDLKARVYYLVNDNSGIKKKKGYWQIGSLLELFKSEKDKLDNDNFAIFKLALKQDWYIQGFVGVPLFLNPTAYSGIVMGESLGYTYDIYLLHYQHKYCEACYAQKELKKVWGVIKRKLSVDPEYLQKVSKEYYSKFACFEKALGGIYEKGLSKISENRLMSLLKKAGQAQVYSVGVSHVIEAVSLGIEKEFKHVLARRINNSKDFNQIYSVLTAPTKISFVAEEERELLKLKKLSGKNLMSSLKKHARKYFWIENSYAGYKILDYNYFLNKLKKISIVKIQNNIKKQKNDLIIKLKLNKNIQQQIELIDFCTVWQDKRKAKILKAIGYLGVVADEISRRIDMPISRLYFLGIGDILNVDKLGDIKNLAPELSNRKQESYFLLNDHGELYLSGNQAKKLSKIKEGLQVGQDNFIENELHGSIANKGTITGNVKICKNLSHIHKIRPGDILVTSMTRPEYMVAIKKAAAIITDEGGITCHAAVISRELGIPCVIGTKIATKVLKDGDKVEVRANHGTVKILK